MDVVARKLIETGDEDGRRKSRPARGLASLARIARTPRGISGSRKGVNTNQKRQRTHKLPRALQSIALNHVQTMI